MHARTLKTCKCNFKKSWLDLKLKPLFSSDSSFGWWVVACPLLVCNWIDAQVKSRFFSYRNNHETSPGSPSVILINFSFNWNWILCLFVDASLACIACCFWCSVYHIALLLFSQLISWLKVEFSLHEKIPPILPEISCFYFQFYKGTSSDSCVWKFRH